MSLNPREHEPLSHSWIWEKYNLSVWFFHPHDFSRRVDKIVDSVSQKEGIKGVYEKPTISPKIFERMKQTHKEGIELRNSILSNFEAHFLQCILMYSKDIPLEFKDWFIKNFESNEILQGNELLLYDYFEGNLFASNIVRIRVWQIFYDLWKNLWNFLHEELNVYGIDGKLRWYKGSTPFLESSNFVHIVSSKDPFCVKVILPKGVEDWFAKFSFWDFCYYMCKYFFNSDVLQKEEILDYVWFGGYRENLTGLEYLMAPNFCFSQKNMSDLAVKEVNALNKKIAYKLFLAYLQYMDIPLI